MKKYWKIPILLILLVMFVLVRHFEYAYFYDPFMKFYQERFLEGTIIYNFQLYFNVFLRFLINCIISLSILWIVFKNTGILKFSLIIFAGFFIILFPVFIYLMNNIQPNDYLAAFYVRRFLVHPLLILILLPAFYYHQLRKRKEKSSFFDS